MLESDLWSMGWVKEAANVVKDKEAAITNVAKDQGVTSPSSSLEVATYQVLGVP